MARDTVYGLPVVDREVGAANAGVFRWPWVKVERGNPGLLEKPVGDYPRREVRDQVITIPIVERAREWLPAPSKRESGAGEMEGYEIPGPLTADVVVLPEKQQRHGHSSRQVHRLPSSSETDAHAVVSRILTSYALPSSACRTRRQVKARPCHWRWRQHALLPASLQTAARSARQAARLRTPSPLENTLRRTPVHSHRCLGYREG